MVPQLELWRRLDTAGDAEKVYNRYAHVGFAPGPPRFHLSSHHGFVLYVDPEQEILATLGVTHLMVSTKEGSRWRPYWNQFLPLEVIGEHYLFALPLERDSASL